MEWMPGSDIVGDFVWCGVSFEVVTKLEIANQLKREFNGFEIREIEMRQERKIKTPKNPKRVKNKRIFLPYTGPELCELWITSWANLDIESSGLKLEKRCKACGYDFYKPQNSGFVLDESSWVGSDFYRIHQFSGIVLCTERVKRFIDEKEYTNVAFIERA